MDRKAKNREEFISGGLTPEAAARIQEAQLMAAEGDAYAEEDRRNRAKAASEIREASQALYGIDDPKKLTSDQLGRVGKKVQVKLHPDKGIANGGDHGAFAEVGIIFNGRSLLV